MIQDDRYWGFIWEENRFGETVNMAEVWLQCYPNSAAKSQSLTEW